MITTRNHRYTASQNSPRMRGLMALMAVLITSLVFGAAMAAPLMGASGDARATVLQDPATHPVANAGPDLAVVTGQYAMLNASASTDDVGIVDYVWTLVDTDLVTLEGKFANYSFMTTGIYAVTLNVSDADGNWDTDQTNVTVTADTALPTSVPGANRTAFLGNDVLFNGSRSKDNTGRIVNYTWNFTYQGEMVYLYGAVVSFTFNETGVYAVTLNVTDPNGLTDEEVTYITIEREPTWLDEHWLGLIFWSVVIGFTAQYFYRKWRRDRTILTATDKDKLRLAYAKGKKTWDLFWATWMGKVGICIIMFFLFVVLLAEVAVPYDPSYTTADIREDPSWDHPFGTDKLGRDILVRTIHGTEASLIVGFVAMGLSMGIGTLVGLASGYWGGWKDEVIMRINDVFLSIPWLVLMIVIASIFGAQDLMGVILVIGVTGWSTTARIVRSQVLSLKARQFVERAKAIGSGEWHIIKTHIFPNVVPLIFANAILTIAISILSESTLSFLGLGPQDVETWGKILEDAYNASAALAGPYTFIIMPGLCIVVVVLGFTFIGYAMDEVLNPKLRKR